MKYISGFPLNLEEHIPVLICESICQAHPHRFSVLPETFPSFGSHDSSPSCFPPALTLSPLSPLQAHHCPLALELWSLSKHYS